PSLRGFRVCVRTKLVTCNPQRDCLTAEVCRGSRTTTQQAYLLPPSVGDELGAEHFCFFVRRVVEGLDLSGFVKGYSEEGGEVYAPELMLGVWLYAYGLGIA